MADIAATATPEHPPVTEDRPEGVRRRDFLDAIAWNKAHPEAERLVRLAQAMRAAQAAGLDVQERLAELERVA